MPHVEKELLKLSGILIALTMVIQDQEIPLDRRQLNSLVDLAHGRLQEILYSLKSETRPH